MQLTPTVPASHLNRTRSVERKAKPSGAASAARLAPALFPRALTLGVAGNGPRRAAGATGRAFLNAFLFAHRLDRLHPRNCAR